MSKQGLFNMAVRIGNVGMVKNLLKDPHVDPTNYNTFYALRNAQSRYIEILLLKVMSILFESRAGLFRRALTSTNDRACFSLDW